MSVDLGVALGGLLFVIGVFGLLLDRHFDRKRQAAMRKRPVSDRRLRRMHIVEGDGW